MFSVRQILTNTNRSRMSLVEIARLFLFHFSPRTMSLQIIVSVFFPDKEGKKTKPPFFFFLQQSGFFVLDFHNKNSAQTEDCPSYILSLV